MLPIQRFAAVRLHLLLVAAVLATGCSRSTPTPPTFNPATFPSAEELRQRIDDAVDHTLNNRTLNSGTHNAWQVVHGILPYGYAFQIEHDGKRIGALEWLMKGGALKGWELRPGDKGVIAVLEPGSKAAQGHPDQWIGYLSQGGQDGINGLNPNDKLTVQGKEYKVGDLLSQAEWDITPGMEASWTLMALSAYRPSDYQWTSRDGQTWTVERVAEMEAGLPVVGEGASCGGTHRLSGLSVALNRYLKETGTPPDKLTGGWRKAEDVVQDCIRKAHSFQQPDGSFSTNFFVRPGNSPEVDSTLHATGHTLEWLVVALDDKTFQEPWVTASVVRLCELLEDNRDRELDCGALYHAARGLKLYRERQFGPRESSSPVAGQGGASAKSAGPGAPGSAAAAKTAPATKSVSGAKSKGSTPPATKTGSGSR